VQDYFKDDGTSSNQSDLLSIKIQPNFDDDSENVHPNVGRLDIKQTVDKYNAFSNNDTSESPQKLQSDELQLSKTDQVSSFIDCKYQIDNSDCYDSNILHLTSKTVQFWHNLEYITPTIMENRRNLDPIPALHHIAYNKGLAWLRSWQIVKDVVSQTPQLHNSLTL
jgi:hypothetical protein